jgi:hypothetical protein
VPSVLTKSSRRPVREAFKIYLALFGSLWGIAVMSVLVRGVVLRQGFPFNTFLLVPSYRFSDFTVYDDRFAMWGHGDKFFSLPGFKFDYPAPMLLGQLSFYRLSSHPLYAYLVTVVVFAVAGAILAGLAIPRESRVRLLAVVAAVSTAVFSFPLFFLLDRANTEGLVWIVCSIGLVLFAMRRYCRAGIFLALATSMKIFPGVLLLLLLAKKRYRDFCISLAAVLAFTIGSWWLAGTSTARAAEGTWEGLRYLREIQIFEYRPIEINFDHSLFAVLKQVCFRGLHDVAAVNALLPHLYLGYGITVLLAFAAAYLMAIRHLPILNQILALSATSVLLPYVSYDYTLVNLFVPFVFLIIFLASDGVSGRLELTRSQILWLLIPYAVIFTPQSYLVYHVVGYAAQVKTLALLTLIGGAIKIPLRSSLFHEVYPSAATLVMDLKLESPAERWARKYA